MTKAAIQQAINTAAHYLQTGRATEAESIFKQVLAAHPDQPAALHGYGLILLNRGDLTAAVDVLRRAAARRSDDAEVRNALGGALARAGHLPEAEAAFRRAIELRPTLQAPHENLASLLLAFGRNDEAVATATRAVTLNPRSVNALAVLSRALLATNRPVDAAAAAEQAIRLGSPAVHEYELLGHALMAQGRADEAIAAYRRGVLPQPGFAVAYSNLGNALQQRGRTEEAMTALQMALRLDPDQGDARNNYGNALKDLARLDEAAVEYRQAVRLRPEMAMFGSNLVYALWFRRQCDPAEVLAESRAWAARHADPVTALAPPNANDRSPDRRLRVGFVSPDFRFHPVGRLIAPLLLHYDRAEWEVVLFCGVLRPDDLTRRMSASVAATYDTRGLSDAQLADLARRAGVDVLVDLQVHMSGTRLVAFARRPAPVQVTYLGYCSTTGMAAMDYCLTDRNLDPFDGPDPPGGAPSPWHAERLLHLDGCYWCYDEPVGCPEPNPSPAAAAGVVTFASLNSFTKLNEGVFDLWAQLLRRVPASRLLLVVPGGPDRQAEVTAAFARRGVGGERLLMSDLVAPLAYFLLYHAADVALDPFPYAGGTTTMDALFMGVPVVTLAGRWATARAGVTLLRTAGLAQWVADTPEQYVQVAADLAADLPALAEWRQTLRGRLRASPLMDGPRFAADVATAFRRAWRHWCDTPPS